jgi:hypothetical protein
MAIRREPPIAYLAPALALIVQSATTCVRCLWSEAGKEVDLDARAGHSSSLRARWNLRTIARGPEM